MGWLFWIIVGIVAGWLAEQIMKTDMGILMNLVVGIAGAVIGGAVVKYLTPFDDDGGFIWSVLVATLGAVILLWGVNKVRASRVAT